MRNALTFRRARRQCAACEGYGRLPASWVFARDDGCTCGQGRDDDLAFHDLACDTVPCPFCQLELTPDGALR